MEKKEGIRRKKAEGGEELGREKKIKDREIQNR